MREQASPGMWGRAAAAAWRVAVLALVGTSGTAGGGGRRGPVNSPNGAVVSRAPTPSVATADLSAVLQRVHPALQRCA